MFTGLVAECGRILDFSERPKAWNLRVACGSTLHGLARGDSIAVNGCCLTAAGFDDESVSFDVLEETRRLTNFSELGVGGLVNLEASLRVGDRLGGHFVSGHIDGVGRVELFERRGADTLLRVSTPAGGGRFLILKGSIAVNGVSLTVATVDADSFEVWLIPTTLEVTNLRALRTGGAVNLEFDLLGKYVEKLLVSRFA